MKKFFFTLLPILLLVAFAPGQAFSCASDTKNESISKPPSQVSKSGGSSAEISCCNPGSSCQQSDDEDCSGKCAGKCNGQCGCTAAHFAAIATEPFDIYLFQPDFTHSGFPFHNFFLSKRSLDIWLPPDIRV